MIARFMSSFVGRLILALALVTLTTAGWQHTIRALSGSEFDPGRIIDGGVFENKNSMGVDQIQQFLEAKVPNCDRWGAQAYGSTTRRAYSESRGVTFPLTCVRDYYENPSTGANNLSGNPVPSGGKSAAQMIFDAAQQYSINPQVLIALLQKEQTIITDDWPWPIQYRTATGYGCPDTAPCDTQYYGFYNQVSNAARQFRRYFTYPNDYSYIGGRNNTIRWSPNASCGDSSLYLTNQATAALYNYTPYRPNQAALGSLYGSGDSCSSYGNRNFWRYFREWFGSTYADPFMWVATGLTITDENRNAEMTTDHLRKDERLLVTITGKNLGSETWYRDGVNPARLGSWNPRDNASKYCDVLWLPISPACNRAAKLVEASVPRDGVFHYEFYIHAPAEGGEFREYYKPLLENRAWMSNETGFHIYVNSTNTYDWRWLYYDAWTDQTKTVRADLNNLAKNQQIYVVLKVKNTSATTWQNSGSTPVRLGTQFPQDHASAYCTPDWVNCTRAATSAEAATVPGGAATFEFTMKTPASEGEYREYLRPVIEYNGWMKADLNHIYLKVTH